MIAVDKILDLREAESFFMAATQALIVEKIDWDFCLEIKENIESGLSSPAALFKAMKDRGYNLDRSLDADKWTRLHTEGYSPSFGPSVHN